MFFFFLCLIENFDLVLRNKITPPYPWTALFSRGTVQFRGDDKIGSFLDSFDVQVIEILAFNFSGPEKLQSYN